MSHEGLQRETARLARRPSEDQVMTLALLVVRSEVGPDEFAVRLRKLIMSAVDIAQQVDFEQDQVSTDSLPQWFQVLTNGAEGGADDDPLGSSGKAKYLQNRNDRPWGLEEWIYCFDPDLRAWEWWDVSINDYGEACVWVDTKGEAHIPCEELWWAIFLAGASDTEPMVLENPSVWARQRSIGL